MWSHGFLMGVQLTWDDWQPLLTNTEGSKRFYPIYLLGGDTLSDEEMAISETLEQRGELTQLIPDDIIWMYRFWQPYRTSHEGPIQAPTPFRKTDIVGRNDDCPCGSGKKIQKMLRFADQLTLAQPFPKRALEYRHCLTGI